MEYKFVSKHFWILRSFFIILHFLCQPLWKYNSHIRVNVEQMSHKIVTYYVEDLNVQESQELVLSFPRPRKMMCEVLVYMAY